MVSRTTAVVLLICIPLPRATATAFPAVMMIMIVTIYNLQLLAASAARVNRLLSHPAFQCTKPHWANVLREGREIDTVTQSKYIFVPFKGGCYMSAWLKNIHFGSFWIKNRSWCLPPKGYCAEKSHKNMYYWSHIKIVPKLQGCAFKKWIYGPKYAF